MSTEFGIGDTRSMFRPRISQIFFPGRDNRDRDPFAAKLLTLCELRGLWGEIITAL